MNAVVLPSGTLQWLLRSLSDPAAALAVAWLLLEFVLQRFSTLLGAPSAREQLQLLQQAIKAELRRTRPSGFAGYLGKAVVLHLALDAIEADESLRDDLQEDVMSQVMDALMQLLDQCQARPDGQR